MSTLAVRRINGNAPTAEVLPSWRKRSALRLAQPSRLIDLGVDGLFSDFPDVAIASLAP